MNEAAGYTISSTKGHLMVVLRLWCREEMTDEEMVIESHLVELESMGFTIVNDVRTVRDALQQIQLCSLQFLTCPCPYRYIVGTGDSSGTPEAAPGESCTDRQARARDKVSSHH